MSEHTNRKSVFYRTQRLQIWFSWKGYIRCQFHPLHHITKCRLNESLYTQKTWYLSLTFYYTDTQLFIFHTLSLHLLVLMTVICKITIQITTCNSIFKEISPLQHIFGNECWYTGYNYTFCHLINWLYRIRHKQTFHS